MEQDSYAGHSVTIVASSPYRARFVPASEATLFTLYPVVIERRASRFVAERLGEFRSHIEGGKLKLTCARWRNASAVRRQLCDNAGSPAAHIRAFSQIHSARQHKYASPFGRDLPFYLDASHAARNVDWDVLAFDVFRGMKGQVPFTWRLSHSRTKRIVSELPFVDFVHFESVVSPEIANGDMLLSLCRQMLEQHTVAAGKRSLVPLRWIEVLHAGDVVMVDTQSPMVVAPFDIHDLSISVGALDARLSA